MRSLEDRRDEFDAMPDAALLAALNRANPFGGYRIGNGRGMLSRSAAIDTLLRYEGYKIENRPAEIKWGPGRENPGDR